MGNDYTNQAWIRKLRTSIEETSYDMENREHMVHGKLTVINFDRFKEEYLKEHGFDITLAYSVDALAKDDKYTYLIEFKNGDFNSTQIVNKLKDSVMMICDVWGKTISTSRKEIKFVLVINKNRYTNLGIQDKIAISKANCSGGQQPIYGLDKANVYVNQAMIFDTDGFTQKLLPKLISV